MSFDLALDALIRGLALGSVYGLAAMGFVIVYSATSVMNFAQGDLMTLGIFAGFTAFEVWQLHPLLALLAALAVPALLGMIENVVAIRPIAKAKTHHAFFVTTFGFAIVIREIAKWVWGSKPLIFPHYLQLGLVDIFGVKIHPQLILTFIGAVAIVLGYALFIDRTRIGNALRATFEDKELAAMRGINVGLVTGLAWALGSMLSGFGGFLIGPLASAHYSAGVELLLLAFIAATIGGYTSVKGSLVGGWIVGVFISLAMLVTEGKFHQTLMFVLLALVLVFRPKGFFGRAVARRV